MLCQTGWQASHFCPSCSHQKLLGGAQQFLRYPFFYFEGGIFLTFQQITNIFSGKPEDILKCEKPKAVGQYLAAQHESKQIKKIADSYSKDLPPADLARADEMLCSENFDDDWN